MDGHAATDPVRAHVIVRGLVQGVYFRASTGATARMHGVSGWVRNLDDGAVEAVFEGPRDAVERVIAWCHIGPPRAQVDEVAVAWEPHAAERGFSVR